MINRLRETRNQIIEQCVGKNEKGEYVLLTEGYKIVRPVNPRISDGAFNNTKVLGVPVYRKLTDAPFGLSTDLEEMSKQISSEDVKIGVGKGSRADTGSEYTIMKLDPSDSETYTEKTNKKSGRSGKLYLITRSVNGTETYIQLHEGKFDKQGDSTINSVNDVEEAFDETGVLIPGKHASTAEIIMRLVTGSLSRSNFNYLDIDNYQQFTDALIDFIVHFDKTTFVDDQYSRDEFTK